MANIHDDQSIDEIFTFAQYIRQYKLLSSNQLQLKIERMFLMVSTVMLKF